MTGEEAAFASSFVVGRSSLTALAAMGPSQPTSIMAALVDASLAADVALTLIFADLTGVFAFLRPEHLAAARNGRLRLLPLAGTIPRLWAGNVDFLPNALWDADRMIAGGQLKLDLILMEVAEGGSPDELSYGDMIGYMAAALETHATAVAVTRPGAPHVTDAPVIALKRFDRVIRGEPWERRLGAPAPLSDQQREIGRRVASLIPDEATLQLGLGSLPEAILQELDGKRDLGIHSGIVTPTIQRLVESGVISGKSKSLDTGKIVATGLVGGEHSDHAPIRDVLSLRPLSETHDPRRLALQERLWTINSALEVDLTGQANAEYIQRQRLVSGGGQGDFVRAGHISPGGASVIALPSRTSKGDSRIVGALPHGHRPTSAAQDIDFVVTEFGSADLRGRSMRERAAALIAIAHPDDRDALMATLREASGF